MWSFGHSRLHIRKLTLSVCTMSKLPSPTISFSRHLVLGRAFLFYSSPYHRASEMRGGGIKIKNELFIYHMEIPFKGFLKLIMVFWFYWSPPSKSKITDSDLKRTFNEMLSLYIIFYFELYPILVGMAGGGLDIEK